MNEKSRPNKARVISPGLLACLFFLSLSASPVGAAKEMRPLEIKQRYAQVLETLATGSLDQAVTDLVEFEQAAVGNEQPWRHVDTLWRAKLQVIRDLLASQDFALLMPIIVLHHDAYFRYAEIDRRHLAQHSRTMSVELAEILADRSGTRAARSFAGWTLVSIATYLWSPSNIGGSADLFYRAQLIDASNDVALTGLGAAWERSGAYLKAIESLTRAQRLRPADPELSLRLALCNMRYPDGAHEQALAQLSSLTKAEAPGWIRSVAYQELARAQWVTDGASSGEAILREGLQELPGDQQLSLQLAAVLDAQRRRGEAMTVLDAIEILGWESESSRQTYDFWQPPDLGVPAKLRQEMETGLAPLAAGLKVVEAGSGGS